MSTVQPLSSDIGNIPKLDDIVKGHIKYHVKDDPMVIWDKGVFINELQKQGIVLRTDRNGSVPGHLAAQKRLVKGTYHGTRMALTEVTASHFNLYGFEPIIPTERNLEQKREIYSWSDPEVDGFPPHLNPVNPPDTAGIFDEAKVAFIKIIASAYSFIIPENIEHEGTPYKGPTLADCEKYNRDNPSPNTDIMDGENLGSKPDWYSDARFAQQHLSGVNPTTIEKAPPEMVKALAHSGLFVLSQGYGLN
ncbi:hypothetical protein F4775DRAFT_595890 [Biscogniauxia sp. FL1348]|nr:hypothetical protein F4775DRAFT_595890 [Biscogniauxia sp. FL1348]